MKKQEIASIKCANCKGKLEISEFEETTVCPFCESVYSTDELLQQNGGKSRVEAIKARAEKDIEISKHQTELEKMKLQHDKEKKENTRRLAEKFKKGKLFKFLIFCIIISALFTGVSFNDGKILQGVIGVVQIILYAGAFLMGLQIIEEKKPGLHVVLAIVGLVLIFPYFNSGSSSPSRTSEEINWDEMPLASIIPEIEGKKGDINSNDLDSLSININDIGESTYFAYVEECIAAGFTIDQEQISGFEAFNQEGYKLNLYHYGSSEKMSIKIDIPKEVSEIVWPTSDLASLIPVPQSSIGKINYERSDAFNILIAETTYEEYQSYVQQCSELGFDVDYDKSDDFYKARNENGVVVRLTYEGFNIMKVELELGEGEVVAQSTTAQSEEVEEATTATPVEGTSDWEQFLIDYEAWVDDYIAFLEKYNENPSDLTLLTEYGTLAADQIQWATDASELEGELSGEELTLYLETMTRINLKLINADIY